MALIHSGGGLGRFLPRFGLKLTGCVIKGITSRQLNQPNTDIKIEITVPTLFDKDLSVVHKLEQVKFVGVFDCFSFNL